MVTTTVPLTPRHTALRGWPRLLARGRKSSACPPSDYCHVWRSPPSHLWGLGAPTELRKPSSEAAVPTKRSGCREEPVLKLFLKRGAEQCTPGLSRLGEWGSRGRSNSPAPWVPSCPACHGARHFQVVHGESLRPGPRLRGRCWGWGPPAAALAETPWTPVSTQICAPLLPRSAAVPHRCLPTSAAPSPQLFSRSRLRTSRHPSGLESARLVARAGARGLCGRRTRSRLAACLGGLLRALPEKGRWAPGTVRGAKRASPGPARRRVQDPPLAGGAAAFTKRPWGPRGRLHGHSG